LLNGAQRPQGLIQPIIHVRSSIIVVEINRVRQTGLRQGPRVPIGERRFMKSGSSGEMQLRDSAWLFRPRACRER
jgi:hypothetical protein